jgi:sporulation protein YlmC with PRC-barrel domain
MNGGARFRRFGAALSFAIVFSATLQARANPCPPSDLARRVAALPAFIVVPPDKNPREALTRALGCGLPPPPVLRGGQLVNPKKLVGHNVISKEGAYVGVVTGTVVDRDTGIANSVVKLGSTGGQKNVAVAVDKLVLNHGSLEISDISDAPTIAFSPGSDSNFEQSWWSNALCSFGEFCGLVSTRIDSKPTGAVVYFASSSSGTTEITGLLGTDDLKPLRIELAGYQPCRYEDGIYRKVKMTITQRSIAS